MLSPLGQNIILEVARVYGHLIILWACTMILPTLFQENPTDTDYSINFQRIYDVLFHFTDLTMKDDIVCATSQPDCKNFCYKAEKLTWLQNQINEIILTCKETPEATHKSELVSTNKLLEDLNCIKESAATVQKEILLHTQEGKLWTVIEDSL